MNRIIWITGLLLLGMAATPASAAIYMKIDGVEGEVTEKGHAGWIELSSLQRGISVTTEAGVPRPSHSVNMSEFTVTKPTDKASLGIETLIVGGDAKAVEIDFVTGGENPIAYLRYKLTNAYITSYQLSSGGDVPTESITIGFETLAVEHYRQDEAGVLFLAGRVTWSPAAPQRASTDSAVLKLE